MYTPPIHMYLRLIQDDPPPQSGQEALSGAPVLEQLILQHLVRRHHLQSRLGSFKIHSYRVFIIHPITVNAIVCLNNQFYTVHLSLYWMKEMQKVIQKV